MWFKTVKIERPTQRPVVRRRNTPLPQNNTSQRRKRTTRNYERFSYITKKYKSLENIEKIKKIFIFSWITIWTVFLLSTIFIYVRYIAPLPSIKTLEDKTFKESSVIYDKKWRELYTMYWEEKRTYVEYNKISKHIVDAIVSGEDKTFFENSWYDIKWLFRAVFNYVTKKSTKIEWTSTLSQQLIKNVFLSNERKLERKIKEVYLSYQLNRKYSKEKILELFLNKISFWSNAYWIEQATRTFLGKSAKDVTILEATLIASLPKWPTYYSPYNHYDRLVWYLYTYQKSNETEIKKIIWDDLIKENTPWVNQFKTFVNNLKWSKLWWNGLILCWLDNDLLKNKMDIDKDWCSIVNYPDLLGFLNSISISIWDEKLEYQVWRKDYMLWRMLEDEKISFDQYKQALTQSIWFNFKKYREEIKAPHFVFYIKEYLTEKYWKDILEEWWLKIYTTLDLDAQNKAEEIIKKQVETNKSLNATNSALVSIDNKYWDVVAYVWSADYFNETIWGNVNMITSKRQPWSSFKSLVYSLAIDKNAIGPLTPIYDTKTTFPWDYTPNNYDLKTMGKMTILTALNYSRNIPAVKAYYLAWWQNAIIESLKAFWINSLNSKFNYWAPLSLWAWEVTPFEMVQAYSVFANLWTKIEINPIKKILDSKWIVVEEKRQVIWKKVLSDVTAYIMNSILSDSSARPTDYWNNALTLKWRKAWAKTWTSNKVFTKNWQKTILPWDLWTAWYTPQYTTVVWSWNSNWQAMTAKADWLWWAAPIWRDFMNYLHTNLKAEDWTKPKSVKTAEISKLTWLLIPEDKRELFRSYNLASTTIFTNIPTKYDNSLTEVEIDASCNGRVSTNTPAWAIQKWYYVALQDIDPTQKTWQAWINEWVKNGWSIKEISNIPNLITSYVDKECEWDPTKITNWNITINSDLATNKTLAIWNNNIDLAYNSDNPLTKLQFLINWTVINEFKIDNLKKWVFSWIINVPKEFEWPAKLTIKAVDNAYWVKEEIIDIEVLWKDTVPPTITITNPESWKISVYDWQFFNLRWVVKDRSAIRTINLYVDWADYKIWLTDKMITYPVNQDWVFPVWTHTLKIEAIDDAFNKWYAEMTFEVMPK